MSRWYKMRFGDYKIIKFSRIVNYGVFKIPQFDEGDRLISEQNKHKLK